MATHQSPSAMKGVAIALMGFVCLVGTAHAAWFQGKVTDIQITAAGNANDQIAVYVNFTPSSPGCALNGMLIIGTDPYFKETMATLLTARALGASIKFDFMYCHTSGLARGNGYMMLGP